MKQTSEKIIAAAEERGYINENEILLLKRRRNRGERIQLENPIPVSYDQAQKGFAWLWDKYRTPRGAERKNNPFRIRRRRRWSGQRCTGPGSRLKGSVWPGESGTNRSTDLLRRYMTSDTPSCRASSPMCCNMGTRYFYDVAKTVATRMEKTTKAERVVTEILERVLGGAISPGSSDRGGHGNECSPRVRPSQGPCYQRNDYAGSHIPRHDERRGKQTQNLLP